MGLLGGAGIDPLSMGLLGAGTALMSGRRGLAQAPMAFAQGMMQGQDRIASQRRQAEMDALNRRVLEQQMAASAANTGLATEKLDMTREQRRAESEAKERTRSWVQQNRPDLLPIFDISPDAVAAQLMPAKPQGPIKLGQGDQLIDPTTFQPLANNPKAPEMTPFERQLRAAGIDPASPQGRSMMEQYARKQMTHAPAANQTVYTGNMVPAEVDGRAGFVMPARDGRAPQVVEGIHPPGTAAAERAKANERRDALNQSRLMVSTVDEALDKVSKWSTGGTGAVLSRMPATEATDLRKTIDTLKGNLAFETLRAMRAASPTGGALGAVSERELALLESTVASLDPNQSADQLRANLNKVKQNFERVRKLIEGGNGQSAQGAGGAVDLQEMARQELLRRGGAR
jgi:hypothetical protein